VNKRFLLISLLNLFPALIQAQCIPASGGNFYAVTDTLDFTPGSLRQIILDANSSNIGGTVYLAAGGNRLYLNAALPAVTCDSLVIFDSFTVILDGQNIVYDPGILITSSSSCIGPFVTGENFLPGVFTVTNTNDSGTGSLREAIMFSEFSPSPDVIHFDIPGVAPHEILVPSAYPLITMQLIIDGTTQPANGYTGTAPKIELNGLDSTITGLYFDSYDYSHQHSSAVKGLYINGFGVGLATRRTKSFICGGPSGTGNVISGNDYGAIFEFDSMLTVSSNFFGTDTSGTMDNGNSFIGFSLIGDSVGPKVISENVISGNQTGAIIYNTGRNFHIWGNLVGTDVMGSYAIRNDWYGIRCSARGVTIGGTLPFQSNLFSGNGSPGSVSGSAALEVTQDVIVIGNKFGTDLSGTDTIPNFNALAIYLSGADGFRIGGASASERNIFSRSAGAINVVDGSGGLIQNNYIGTDITGSMVFPNNYTGISISLADNIKIQDNLITGSYNGISIGSLSTGDTIAGNIIYGNTQDGIRNVGQYNLITLNSIYDNSGKGIELDSTGNTNILTPVITDASQDSITGTSLPNATIELYYSQSLNLTPQGKVYISTVNADANGDWTYIGPITNIYAVTATQTDSLNNTSEFCALWDVGIGLPEISENDLLIYPNPTPEILYLELNVVDKASAVLTDVTGKVVMRTEMINGKGYFPVINLNPGSYTVKIISAKGVFIRKVLVIK
jgi:hypothetical protein